LSNVKGRQFDGASVVAGTVIGLIAGVAAGVVVTTLLDASQATSRAAHAVNASGPANVDEALPAAKASFAQQGEDLVIAQMLSELHVDGPTYIDIGAHHPIVDNNTFLLYRHGGTGVLVEPNPVYAAMLRKYRARDIVLEEGIGTTDQAEADYYVMDGDGQLNTFSKEQADLIVARGRAKLLKVIPRPLVPLDAVLQQYFPRGAPDVLSIDIEGLDLAVLRTLDWNRWRPRIVCVETADARTGDVEQEIIDLLVRNGYEARGGSFVNTIFLERRDRRQR